MRSRFQIRASSFQISPDRILSGAEFRFLVANSGSGRALFQDADFSFHVSDFEFSLQSGSRGAFHFSILDSRFKLREEDDQEMTRSALSISQFSFLGSKARSLIANPPGLRFSFRVSRFHFGALSRTLERAHFSILLSGFYFQGRAGK